ncbi:toxin [Bacteroidia bacterium]|nr:toxin [Bacteroidia bacterium]
MNKKFEFDEAKSTANKIKHGIDFIEAQSLWDDPNLIEVPAKYQYEDRYIDTGWIATADIGGRIYTAVITYRGSAIRIISVRRAHKNEEKRYDENKK